jgi:phosphoribosylformylglycinamidine (FGAM) synthase-like amidotransferase family enzyme
MRIWFYGIVLAALSASAGAQDSAWGYFDAGAGPASGAGVQAKDGSQLLIKCEKPGKHEVYVVIAATSNLAAPLPENRFESRAVTLRMDSNAPWDDNWRFNDKFAMAVDKGNDRSLTRLLAKLDGAKALQVQLRPFKAAPVLIDFNVSGSHDTIARVYQACQDDNPVGRPVN